MRLVEAFGGRVEELLLLARAVLGATVLLGSEVLDLLMGVPELVIRHGEGIGHFVEVGDGGCLWCVLGGLPVLVDMVDAPHAVSLVHGQASLELMVIDLGHDTLQSLSGLANQPAGSTRILGRAHHPTVDRAFVRRRRSHAGNVTDAPPDRHGRVIEVLPVH